MQINEQRLLKFAIEYPGWHSCGHGSCAAMKRLAAAGLLVVAYYDRAGFKRPQPKFRIALPEWAHEQIGKLRDSDCK